MGLFATSLNYAFPTRMTESADGQEIGCWTLLAASMSIPEARISWALTSGRPQKARRQTTGHSLPEKP